MIFIILFILVATAATASREVTERLLLRASSVAAPRGPWYVGHQKGYRP